jgi:hypothetical protein
VILAAYRPLIDPLDLVVDLQSFWYLLIIPLCFLISMAWKAVRVPDLSTYWKQVVVMTGQSLLAMLGLWILTTVTILYIMPFLHSKGI